MAFLGDLASKDRKEGERAGQQLCVSASPSFLSGWQFKDSQCWPLSSSSDAAPDIFKA